MADIGKIGITKELLEAALKERILDFEVRPGTKVGDGFTCDLWSVDVRKESDPERVLHILVKCFPVNETRQANLDEGGAFTTELEVYRELVPELIRFQEEAGVEEIIRPPLLNLIHGQYIPPAERKNSKPADNHIIMPDLRSESNGSFRLRDRFQGFDRDHYALVIEAQAKLHALSWAYRCKAGLGSLREKFPCLQHRLAELIPMIQGFTDGQILICKNLLKGQPRVQAALDHLKSVQKSAAGLYYEFDYGQTTRGHTRDNILKSPGPVNEDEEPWRAAIHGDAWNNNMLFRYDSVTGKPVEVIFIDLQLTNEAEPMGDICYTLYCSVAPGVRAKHLQSFLHIYFDTFTRVCDQLLVPYFPGWSFEEFLRRFHRTKVLGAIAAVVGLPLMLKNPPENRNLDKSADESDKQNKGKSKLESGANFFVGLTKSSSKNPILEERLLCVFEDLINDGVL